MQVVTSPVVIVHALKKAILSKYWTDLNFIYDPYGSYETSIEQVRTFRKKTGKHKVSTFPLLGWTRDLIISTGKETILKPVIKVIPTLSAREYKGISSSFNFHFSIYVTDHLQMDNFEVLYNSKSIFNQILELLVDIPKFGVMKYIVRWDRALSDLAFVNEGTSYLTVNGKARISGYFLTMEETDTKIIGTINAQTHLMDLNEKATSR